MIEEQIKRMASIALTEFQISYVTGIDLDELCDKYGTLIKENLPRDFMMLRWRRFSKVDPDAAAEARRFIAKNYKFSTYHRVKASLNAQLRSRYFGVVNNYGRYPIDYLKFDIHDLIKCLESQFRDGMSWDNYGSWWEIDHKVPASWFNVESLGDEQFNECWDIDNFQPLEKINNRVKSNRWSDG